MMSAIQGELNVEKACRSDTCNINSASEEDDIFVSVQSKVRVQHQAKSKS